MTRREPGGENGAGKSTPMNIVSGQYSADHGTVSVQGNQLTAGAPATPDNLVTILVAAAPFALIALGHRPTHRRESETTR
jgi:ABC-type branched-subunit amino acid transport system ATPase component